MGGTPQKSWRGGVRNRPEERSDEGAEGGRGKNPSEASSDFKNYWGYTQTKTR